MNSVASLLFGTWVSGEARGYTEEIHLLEAENLAEAQASAERRGQAQETDYVNANGQEVTYRLLAVADVQPRPFESAGEALYTRSFSDLAADRETANPRGPLRSDVVNLADLPALASALHSLFDSRFRAGVEPEGLGFIWCGRSIGSLGVRGMEQSSVAWAALSTAHDVVLEGLGEDGEHPGALATASCVVGPVPSGWRLCLVAAGGTELSAAVWVKKAHIDDHK